MKCLESRKPLIKLSDSADVVTNLAEMLVQVGQRSGDDSSVTVALSATRDGKCLSAAGLSIGKDCTIVPCQHTETHNMELFKMKTIRRKSVFNQPKNAVFSMAS